MNNPRFEKILKRKLKDSESVHHINIVNDDDSLENLYIYNSEEEHMDGHKSLLKSVADLLESLYVKSKPEYKDVNKAFIKFVAYLFKNNIIEFVDGTYRLKK